MGAPYPEEDDPETAERQPNGPKDPQSGRTIRGECHDAVNGQLYAVDISVTSTGPDNLATFTNGVSGVLNALGLELRVSCRPLGGNRAWDGTNRV